MKLSIVKAAVMSLTLLSGGDVDEVMVCEVKPLEYHGMVQTSAKREVICENIYDEYDFAVIESDIEIGGQAYVLWNEASEGEWEVSGHIRK